MKILRLACNNCGGPLEVATRARFVTCTFCNTSLRIERSEKAAWTEAVEQIADRTARMEEDLEVLKQQGKLERLDREWNLQRSALVFRDKEGHESVPSVAGSVFGAVACGIMTVFFFGVTSSVGAPGFVKILPLVPLGMGIMVLVTGLSRTRRYSESRQRYERQRRQLLDAQGERT